MDKRLSPLVFIGISFCPQGYHLKLNITEVKNDFSVWCIFGMDFHCLTIKNTPYPIHIWYVWAFEHKCHFLYQFSKVSCRGPDRGKLLFSLSMTLCSESLTKPIGTCCVLVCSKVFCHEGWGRYTQLQVSLLLNDFSSKKKKRHFPNRQRENNKNWTR